MERKDTARLIGVALLLGSLWLWSWLGSGVGVAVASFSQPAAATAPGGRLVVAVPAEPPQLDPTTNAAAAIDQIVNHNIYEGLVMIDPEGNIVPGLAESWEISEDGLVYTFHLRRGVKFHDGHELTAADVIYTFERNKDPATGVPHPEYYEPIESIEALDDYTVQFTLSRVTPHFLAILGLGDSIILPAGAGEELKSRPNGTGPFEFVEWVPGDHITLARFEDYWQEGIPYLDEVVFKFIPDPSAALAALLAGDVDIVVRMDAAVALTVRETPGFKVISGPQNLVQIMAINNAREPFDDVRVRRAIAYAINKEEVIQGSMFGWGTPIGSHLTPVSPYYIDLNWMYPYDPERAKELLAEAGYPDGFEATLKLPQPYALHIKTGEIIADQLSRVGIQLKLEIIEWGRWLEEVYENADYDLTIIGHIGKMDPAADLSGYGPERPDYYFRRGWSNPYLDKLMELGATTADFEERLKIYAIVQYIIAEEAVNYFIQDPHQLVGMAENVHGFEIFPIYVADVTRVWKE